MIIDRLRHPIVLAPMAGGPSTPALAAAVTEAGGLGLLAGAYRGVEDLRGDIRTLRSRTEGPFGVNIFVPAVHEAPPGELERYLTRLQAEADRYGVRVGEPRSDDDGWDDKLAMLGQERVPLVSFTFGCPPPAVVAAVRATGAEVWVTVNHPDEATAAEGAGADVLVVQGVEAGGHQGGWMHPADGEGFGVLALLRLVAARTGVPLVAAGGLGDGAAVAGALVAGAAAAQCGTVFLRTDEAGTNDLYRDALARGGATAMTRAFSGRPARGLRNRFLDELGPHAPGAFPAVLHAAAPVRAAARAAGDSDGMSLWAGQAHALAGGGPAGDVVAALAAGAREALDGAARRLDRPAR